MKHVAARYRAQLGNVSLANVSKHFLKQNNPEEMHILYGLCDFGEKMALDSVSIRHLYFDSQTGEERFDERRAFDDRSTDSMSNIIIYNIQDCLVVHELVRRLKFIDTIVVYSGHFGVSPIRASYVGNSQLLPYAIVTRTIQSNGLIVAHRTDPRLRVPSHVIVQNSGNQQSSSATSDKLATRFDSPTRYELLKRHANLLLRDEVDLMRIDRTKLYMGGINSAEQGHYRHVTSVDFSSFYPSIGITFNLSYETTHILTVAQLFSSYSSMEELNIDLKVGSTRVFDYEPPMSPNVTLGAIGSHERNPLPMRMSQTVQNLREKLSRDENNKFGWYDGVELFDVSEIVHSSANLYLRRLLVIVRSSLLEAPVISSLWQYYLQQRTNFKNKIKELKHALDAMGSVTQNDGASMSDVISRLHETSLVTELRRCESMERVYKIVANSLYGYLNFQKSIIYSPTVAATITLLSRKTFCEMGLLCEQMAPTYMSPAINNRSSVARVVTVYRDTDGAVIATNRPLQNAPDFLRQLNRTIDLETADPMRQVCKLAYHCDDRVTLRLELECCDINSLTIMGRKKYWRAMREYTEILSKGFERNAQAYIKPPIRALQRATAKLLLAHAELRVNDIDERFLGTIIVIADVEAFFVAAYRYLHNFARTKGSRSFAFKVPLNPREFSTGGAEAEFIQRTLSENNYDVGDRVLCVY